jgi:drug/metabolite transporter (DMT)-like permease
MRFAERKEPDTVPRSRAKVLLSMLTLYVVWGTTYLGIKVGLAAGLPATLFAGIRQFPAAALTFAIAAWRGASLKISPRDLRISAIAGLCLIVGGQYFTFLAEQSIPSGLAALLVALVPLWVALAESALPGMRRPGWLGWVGLAIGFSGLGILLAPQLATAGTATGAKELIGTAVMISGGWLWTGGTIYAKRNPASADPLVITSWEMVIAGVVLLVIATIAGDWSHAPITLKGVAALAYMSVVGSAVALTAFGYALKHLPASKVMTYAFVNPVIAVFAGYVAGAIHLVDPEPITWPELLGMAVIVAGVAITTAAPTHPSRSKQSPATLAEEIAPNALDEA